ncbi:MAG: penicillin acylase family protein, partial [Anaerolineae bacterium]|nr:penicillin acylase family protein [Anaerolineae bacterium]
MRIFRIILLALLLVLVVALVGGFVIFNKITKGPLPTINGEVQLTGLQDTVTIKRDEWGVPAIYATNTHDLLFAQGYTHAQDRWWQMEWFRAVGDGRLQELTGKNADLLSNDVFIRTIGWRRAANRDLETYDPETMAYLQAFTDGINAYILDKNGGDLAFEYSILGVTGVNIPVRPWTLGDTIVWQKVMSWDLSNQLYDLDRADYVDLLGEDLYNAYKPPYPFDSKPTIVQAEALPITQESSSLAAYQSSATLLPVGDTQLAGNFIPQGFAFGSGEGIGSNNWVVSGDLTESGMPLLANDPHLGIQMPSIWYEIGLHCRPITDECPFDVKGFTFAPFAGIVIGHNNRIAWGFTNVDPDVMDLYNIEINPENELQYKWDGEWRDLTVHEEIIRYGDSDETLTLMVRETHLGPIMNDNRVNDDGTLSGFNNEDPVALRWTALDQSRTLKALFDLDKAQNWDEFRAAASLFDAPSQNLVYADVDGNIGYQTPGLIPVRPAGVSGELPLDGTTSANEWLGYIPYDLLPRVFNPPSGIIHSANEALVIPEYYEQLAEQLADQYGAD